jgi:O-acetylhomoserine/O-acetylserine sulfhydrylase-like pyridoxal-dependent enzyme
MIFNPFDYGADFVVSSLSKYYSGGTTIAGILVGKLNYKNISTNIILWLKMIGASVSPIIADILLYQLDTLEKRIFQSSELTKEVIKNMIKKKFTISHPIICGDKLKYFKNNLVPSVFTFKLCANNIDNKLNNKQINKIDLKNRKKLQNMFSESKFQYKTSFGGSMSRIDRFPTSKKGVLIGRIAIGYNDNIDNIIECIDNIIELCTEYEFECIFK